MKLKKWKTPLLILFFVSAHLAHHLLTAMLMPLLPFIRDDFSLSYAQSGGIFSAFAIAYGFGHLPAGWIADRIGPRYLFLAGISGVALASAFIGLSLSYISLIVFLVMLGFLGGGYHTSASPLIAAVIPKHLRGRAIGFHMMGGSSGNFLAPLAAVFIAGFLGWRGAYLSISIPVMIFGILLFTILYKYDINVPNKIKSDVQKSGHTTLNKKNQAKVSGGPAVSDIADHDLAAKKPLKQIILFLIMSASIGACMGSTISFIPLYIVDHFETNAQAAAVLLSVYFGAGMVAAPLGGLLVDRFGAVAVFVIIAVLSGPALFLLGVMPNWIFLIALMLVLGAVSFIRMTASEIYFVTHVPLRYRSTVIGVYFFAGMESRGIITPVVGGAIDAWGFIPAFAAMGGVLSFVLIICGLLFSLEQRRTPIAIL